MMTEDELKAIEVTIDFNTCLKNVPDEVRQHGMVFGWLCRQHIEDIRRLIAEVRCLRAVSSNTFNEDVPSAADFAEGE
jgi:hypothetical protein